MNGMQSDPPGDQCVLRLTSCCIWVSQMFCVCVCGAYRSLQRVFFFLLLNLS